MNNAILENEYCNDDLNDENLELYKVIVSAYAKMCNDSKLFDCFDIALDIHKLSRVIDRYLFDIERLETSHPTVQTPDCYKVASYLTYWICKEKPIYVTNPNVYKRLDKNFIYYVLNEVLALYVSIGRINANNRLLIRDVHEESQSHFGKRILRLSQLKAVMKDILYTFAHCNISSETLWILYYYIDITSSNADYLKHISEKTVS